jgi:hypothetical protein
MKKNVLVYLIYIVMITCLESTSLYSQTSRTWVGNNANKFFNLADNWSPNGVPSSTDTLIINSTNHDIGINIGAFAKLIVESGFTGTIRLSGGGAVSTDSIILNSPDAKFYTSTTVGGTTFRALTVRSFNLLDGEFYPSTNSSVPTTITKSLFITDGYIESNNTFLFFGGSSDTISNIDITGDFSVNTLIFQNSLILQRIVNINGNINTNNLQINSGTGDRGITFNNGTINITGNITFPTNNNTSTASGGNSDFKLSGTGNVSVGAFASSRIRRLPNIIIDKTGGRVTFNENYISGNLIFNSGDEIRLGTSSTTRTIDIDGDWIIGNGLNVESYTSKVIFNGGKSEINNAENSFYDLEINCDLDLSGNFGCNNFSVNDKTINILSDIEIDLLGDWSVDSMSTFNNNGNKVKINFNGSSPQSINHNGRILSAININSDDVSLSSDLSIEDEVTFFGDNRTFTTTGHTLTLLSNASQTARIGALTSGSSITGNIIQQRFIPGGSTGWVFFGSPVQNATLQSIQNSIITSGFPGSNYPSHSFTSIYSFDETINESFTNGFVYPNNITNNMSIGKGYAVYTGTSQFTTTDLMITFSGTPNTAQIDLPVTFTSNNTNPENDGWNLVANPYPSPILWSELTKTNISDEIHVYNADLNGGNGAYATYIDGVSNPSTDVGGIGDVIPSCQGFYVKAIDINPSLIVQESHKANILTQAFLNTVQPNGNNILRLALTNQNKRSETVFRFHDEGSVNYNPKYDANKFYTSNINSPEISSVLGDKKLSINSLPNLDSTYSIPLHIKATDGNYDISVFNLHEFNNSSCLTLEDLKTNNFIDFRNQHSYSFNFSNSDIQPRFIVHIGEQTKFEVELEEITCFNANDAEIKFTPLSNGTYNLYYLDNNNDTIRQILNTSINDTLTGLGEGFYRLSIQKNGACGTVDLLDFNVQNPLPNNLSSSIINSGCFSSINGMAVINLETNGPWNVLWTNTSGDTIKISDNINTNDTLIAPMGEYYATIDFNNNCGSIVEQLNIFSQSINSAMFNILNNNICFGTSDAIVEINDITNYPVEINI